MLLCHDGALLGKWLCLLTREGDMHVFGSLSAIDVNLPGFDRFNR